MNPNLLSISIITSIRIQRGRQSFQIKLSRMWSIWMKSISMNCSWRFNLRKGRIWVIKFH